MLMIIDLPKNLTSRTRILAKCICGRVFTLLYGNLPKTVSCGKCNYKSKEYWLSQTWGSLSLCLEQLLPEEWALNSHQQFKFRCNCTRVVQTKFQSVTTGNSTTCGQCDFRSKTYWLTQHWGSLSLMDNDFLPPEWGAGSNKRFKFNCICGNIHTSIFQNVTKGDIQSCGKCRHKSKDFWLSQRWGKLRIDKSAIFPPSLPMFSSRKVQFICTCGKSVQMQFSHVTQGNAKTCGKCNWKPMTFWESKQWGNLILVKGQKLKSEMSPKSNRKLKFICKCGKVTAIRFADVNDGSSSSCGCLQIGQNEFSKENEVRQYVRSLAPDTYPTSYPIEGTRKSYDIYTPSAKLAIEYHGLNWHSEQFKRGQQDESKFVLAQSRGDRLIQIYSDEWRDKQEIMKEMLASLLSPTKGKRIKPIFTLHTKTPPEARSFLDQHHYLGAASGCLTVLAKDKDQIVGVWIFMKRETGVILWHRACVDHKFKMWNPHEKVLHLALPELKKMGFKRMVTFSDNRFHTGELYTKLGFKFEENIRADYGYTNGIKRLSKYRLRVKAGVNEKAEAMSNGWYRIWDSGKKRFSLSLV
jgi:hypothetical protein